MPTTPPLRSRRRLGHLVVAATLALIGLGLAAWIDHHFAQLDWGPGDVLRAQFRGTGGVDCPCELAAAPLLPGEGLAAGLLVLASGCLGFALHARERAWRVGFFGSAIGSGLVALVLLSSLGGEATPALPLPEESERLRLPALVAFHAPWCARTSLRHWPWYQSAEARRAMQGLTFYELDLGQEESELVQGARRRWEIAGLPTVLFLDEQGQELLEYRVNTFEEPKAFARRLRCVRAVLEHGAEQAQRTAEKGR